MIGARSLAGLYSLQILIQTARQQPKLTLIKRKSDPDTGPVWPRGWVEVQHYSSMTAALEGGEWSAARPGRNLPPGKDPLPILQEAG